jgi:hypothetical protein
MDVCMDFSELRSRSIVSEEHPHDTQSIDHGIVLTREKIFGMVMNAAEEVNNRNNEFCLYFGKKIGNFTAEERKFLIDAIGEVSNGLGSDHNTLLNIIGLPRVIYQDWANDSLPKNRRRRAARGS